MSLFSTEQVSKYHPDKYADQISDAILTECLRQDKNSRVAVETLVKNKTVVIAGEITTTAKINYEEIARKVATKLNYEIESFINLISKQSPQISQAVTKNEGAGDNGIMFGFATSETDSYLPKGFDYANKIIKAIESDVETNKLTILKGDAKTQVTIDTDTNEIKTVVINACHKELYTELEVKEYIINLLHKNSIYIEGAEYLTNTAGLWTIGGAIADAGLTGRKIVCDQYGGFNAVGGGAFSGKDPTKVDRSATYMARHIAKDLVKKFNLKQATVQLGYAIGKAEPISIAVNTNITTTNTSINTNIVYIDYIRENYDLTPKGIIKKLKLLEINYEKVAEGCHFYNNETWEG